MADLSQQEFETWFAKTYPINNLENNTEEALRKMIANQAWRAARRTPTPWVYGPRGKCRVHGCEEPAVTPDGLCNGRVY